MKNMHIIYKKIIFTVYLLCFAVHTETVNETARFLAGKGVPADSKLAEYVQSKFYAEYAGQVRSGWIPYRAWAPPNA
ncbi:MAG TPA: hypothetical protein PK453_20030, partial [Leptospiraceae bacterium]|nr:hypothetical protein [Leptospiraceae bacterium]